MKYFISSSTMNCECLVAKCALVILYTCSDDPMIHMRVTDFKSISNGFETLGAGLVQGDCHPRKLQLQYGLGKMFVLICRLMSSTSNIPTSTHTHFLACPVNFCGCQIKFDYSLVLCQNVRKILF